MCEELEANAVSVMLLEGSRTHQSSEKITMDDGVPYLEMKSRPHISSKENVPVEPSAQSSHKGEKHDSSHSSVPFSSDFERTKQKCQQDFRLDYRRHVSQRKESDSGQTSAQPQELSLPIRERRSAKARLRDERNREYNAFLKQKGAQAVTRTLPDYLKSKPTATTSSSPPPPPAAPQAEPRGVGLPARPRRDAATLTDPRSEEAAPAPRRHWGDGPLRAERRPRRLRSYYVYSDEDLSYEEEEEYEDEDEELEPEQQAPPPPRRQPGVPRDDPAYSGKRDRERRGHQHRTDRVAPERRVVQAPILRAEEVVEDSRRTLSAMHTPNPQAEPAPAKASERSRSAANKNMADFSTGLIIGACEGNVAQQRRKERYRQELLEQMAEQQKNKKKEKELELRVAASGAVDPEKQPDRIKQFGAVTRNYERRQPRDVPYRPGPGLDSLGADPAPPTTWGPGAPPPPQDRPPGGDSAEERAPPDRPRVAFQSPPLLDYSSSLAQLGAGTGVGRVDVPGGFHNNDEFHRSMAGTLGEMITPRVSGGPPPAAPVLPDAYRTPYDEAYYYYGARNPLDPGLAYYGPGAMGIPPYPHLPLGIPAHLKAAHAGTFTQVPGQLGLAPSGMGVFAGERSKQTKDSAVMYQEQLRQQEEIREEWRLHFRKIRERQERRVREREEQERYDARLEAEMKTYEPWGRGGGGAPLKDHHGNLISDLKRMHRVNEEAYLNPESRWDTTPSGRNAPTPRDDRVTSPLMMAAAGHPQGGVYARGNVFKDVPTPQQLQEQDRYKEYLMQQIAEKRRKEAEERERQREEEEREEKRLLEQRAQIQKEYEEEQERRRRKEMEQMAKNEELVRQAEERREEAERKKREEEERASQSLRLQHERERQARLEECVTQMNLRTSTLSSVRCGRSSEPDMNAGGSQEQRAPSPPIPTLQKLLGRQRTPRPPSGESRHSAGASTVRSLSAPHSPPVPACKNQLRARGEQLTTREEKQNVISELSALSRQLRNEQRRLERQKLQTEREEMETPLRDRPKERPTLKDVFDMARLRLQVSAKRPGSRTQGPAPGSKTQGQGPAPVNMQNIHDFNQLRNRDSSSREEVRQAYPDPPYDDGSLEIQQQALLRQQQRKLHNMKKEKHTDYFDLTSSSRPSQHQRLDSAEDGPTPTLLQSESAFIDSHAGVFPGSEEVGREGRGSARERRRLARKMDFQKEPEGPAEGLSVRSPNVASVRDRNQQRLRRLDNMSQPSIKSGELRPDDDDFWRTSPPLPLDDDRRVSVDTVATEPWLRPGTADSIKHFLSGTGPFFKPLAHDWQQQQQQQQGPSTYHG